MSAMRPRHDPPGKRGTSPARGTSLARSLVERLKRRGRRPGGSDVADGEPCPVDPDRPLDLSGGAAAALTFED